MQEVVAAIEGGCNIIPVLDSFQWPAPETLPEDMRSICYFNGIRYRMFVKSVMSIWTQEFVSYSKKKKVEVKALRA